MASRIYRVPSTLFVCFLCYKVTKWKPDEPLTVGNYNLKTNERRFAIERSENIKGVQEEVLNNTYGITLKCRLVKLIDMVENGTKINQK